VFANVVLPAEETNDVVPNTLVDFRGPFRERNGKRKEREKERDGRDGRKHLPEKHF